MKKIQWNTDYAKNLFNKCIITIIALTMLLVLVMFFTNTPKETAVVGVSIIGYFIFSACDIYFNDKNNQYYTVHAAVVSNNKSRRNLWSKKCTYRLIPVDENGDYLNRNGKYDIFLEFSPTQNKTHNLIVGRIYEFSFLETEFNHTGYSEKNLVCVSPVKSEKI